jgi:hypothetical protein
VSTAPYSTGWLEFRRNGPDHFGMWQCASFDRIDATMAEFFYRRGDKVCGPVSARHIRALAAAGEIISSDFVRKGNEGKWILAERAKGLIPAVESHDESSPEAEFDAFMVAKAREWGAAAWPRVHSFGLSAARGVRRSALLTRRYFRRRRQRAQMQANLKANRPIPKPTTGARPAPAPAVGLIPQYQAAPPARIPQPRERPDALGQFQAAMTAAIQNANAKPPERVLLVEHASMFRNSPFSFLICVALIPVGIGLVILFIWWLSALATTLKITNRRATLRYGLISKYTSEVRHEDVRNLQVSQSILQRLFGVGRIAISSSGQSGMEIDVSGIRDPESIKTLINRFR